MTYFERFQQLSLIGRQPPLMTLLFRKKDEHPGHAVPIGHF